MRPPLLAGERTGTAERGGLCVGGVEMNEWSGEMENGRWEAEMLRSWSCGSGGEENEESL